MQRLSDTDALEKIKARVQADREKNWELNGGFIPPSPPSPLCPTCNGAGAFLRRRADPSFGSSQDDLVTCPDCYGQGIRDKEKVIHQLRQTSGMEHHNGMTFDYVKPFPWQVHMWDAGMDYASNPNSWLWLTGGYTTGKTCLSILVGNHFLDCGKSVVFRDVPKMLDELRHGYSKDAESGFDEQMERLRSTKLLILDDYGKQSEYSKDGKPSWASDKLFQITKWRLERSMPTIVTTNLTMDEMDGQSSRLFQHVMQVDGALMVNFPDKRPE